MKTVRFHTLGCKVNQYETEAMKELFENEGYKVLEEGSSDIYVVNTCTVTNMSDRKSRQFIRRAKRSNKDALVVVVGCYSQVSPEEVEKIEEVDIIIGTKDRDKIVDLVEDFDREKGKVNIVSDSKYFMDFEKLEVDTIDSRTRAYIKIQDGCNQFCSYCIIPYARGPIRSRELSDIVEEAEDLGRKGFKEVVLTGIHVASYGKDFKDENLSLIDVIEEIAKIDSIKRIRLSSIEPKLIDDDFMKRAMKTGKLCDHFHLSLQSGSDTVLKRMNRKYTSQEFKDIVEIIRNYMPKAGITTDIIVGFPGETEEEFEETYKFAEEIKFSKIHVFKYSPREGTKAAAMKNQIDGNIKNERSQKLLDLNDSLMEDFNKSLIGEELEVLFENDDKDYSEGYARNYALVSSDNLDYKGEIKRIKIRNINKDSLNGKVI